MLPPDAGSASEWDGDTIEWYPPPRSLFQSGGEEPQRPAVEPVRPPHSVTSRSEFISSPVNYPARTSTNFFKCISFIYLYEMGKSVWVGLSCIAEARRISENDCRSQIGRRPPSGRLFTDMAIRPQSSSLDQPTLALFSPDPMKSRVNLISSAAGSLSGRKLGLYAQQTESLHEASLLFDRCQSVLIIA